MSKKPLVIAAIQARSASSRLPKKAFAPILGVPMVLRIAERLSACSTVDRVVLATTRDASDDDLAELATEHGLAVYRGAVDDLVERLLLAVEGERGDVLVRVWGDCPFVDPELIDHGVERLLTRELDFLTTGVPTRRSFPAGIDFEVYRERTLRAIHRASADPFFREFPFEYALSGRDGLRAEILQSETDDSDLYLTVDYPDDLDRARQIYEALFDAARPFKRRALVEYCRANPSVGADAATKSRNPEYFAKKAERA